MPRDSKKRRILLYFTDRQWHTGLEMTQRFGWAWNQRKNEMQRLGRIEFEARTVRHDSSNWEYRLVTPNDEIDFVNCCRKITAFTTEKNGQIAFV